MFVRERTYQRAPYYLSALDLPVGQGKPSRRLGWDTFAPACRTCHFLGCAYCFATSTGAAVSSASTI
jgi:hypothetical protein